MSYKITYSTQEIEDLLARVRESIARTRHCSDKIEIVHCRDKDQRRAQLFFTPEAYCKMYALVDKYSTEVEWHALVRRLSETDFEVYDILVFPHATSAARVVSDQQEYEKWINDLDDNTFNAMKCHGHSHVNMGVTPSGEDMTYRDRVVSQLPSGSEEDTFYIFYILNKNHTISAQIYDITNNIMYDTKYNDITVGVRLSDGTTTDEFVDAAKTIAKPAPTASVLNKTSFGDNPYSGFSGSSTTKSKSDSSKEKTKTKKDEAEEKRLKDAEREKLLEDTGFGRYRDSFYDRGYYGLWD